MRSPLSARGPGSTPSAFAWSESERPILTGMVGPPGHVLTAWAAANWMRSATPTSFSFARFPRLPHSRSRPLFSKLEHSLARINEPSQAPLKQSWKEARIAARAASVHWPSARNCAVRVVEISLQTAGHVASSFFGPLLLIMFVSQLSMVRTVRLVCIAADWASSAMLKA